jgi:hypothetical protein
MEVVVVAHKFEFYVDGFNVRDLLKILSVLPGFTETAHSRRYSNSYV